MKVQMSLSPSFGILVPSRDIAATIIGACDGDYLSSEPGSKISARTTLEKLTGDVNWNDMKVSNGLRKKYTEIYNKLMEIREKYDFPCPGYRESMSYDEIQREAPRRTRALDEGVAAIGSDEIDLEFEPTDFFA